MSESRTSPLTHETYRSYQIKLASDVGMMARYAQGHFLILLEFGFPSQCHTYYSVFFGAEEKTE